MIFLALMPLGASFFNYIVPSRSVHATWLPALNGFSYWVFLFGGLLLNASWFAGRCFTPDAECRAKRWVVRLRQPDGATVLAGTEHRLLDAGPAILGISSLAAGFNFIVTILNLRAPG